MKNKYIIKTQSECILVQDDLLILKKQIELLKPSQIVLVCDKKVQNIVRSITRSLQVRKSIFLNIQESSKSINMWMQLQKQFYKWNLDRKSVVLAVGGGVVGDLVGFVCHTYMRGVSWVSIPTTLLSQLDSGVGGKNAINTNYSKNIIGTVYQPRICYLSADFFKTLPEREITSGLGEALKYTYLTNRIRVNVSDFKARNYKKISKMTSECLNYKMSLVCRDPLDILGVRQKLNFGHTFAHSLETATNFRKFRHGEAVIHGIRFALIVSKNKGLLKDSLYETYRSNLMDVELPRIPRSLSGEELYRLAQKDKKSISGEIKMVLLEKKGKIRNSISVTKEEFLTAYEQLKLHY